MRTTNTEIHQTIKEKSTCCNCEGDYAHQTIGVDLPQT